jgi:hypothetical protein
MLLEGGMKVEKVTECVDDIERSEEGQSKVR